MSLGALEEEIFIISKNGDLHKDRQTERQTDMSGSQSCFATKKEDNLNNKEDLNFFYSKANPALFV